MNEEDRARLRAQIAQAEAEYEAECVRDKRFLTGLLVGTIIMLAFAYGVYWSIDRYVKTMPHPTFNGFSKP